MKLSLKDSAQIHKKILLTGIDANVCQKFWFMVKNVDHELYQLVIRSQIMA